jgi:hypothetical protein
VRRNPNHCAGQVLQCGPAFLHQTSELVEPGHETALAGVRRQAAEVRMRVEDRQQGQCDAGFLRGPRDAARHLGNVGIGLPVEVVVKVMELADTSESRLQHLDVGLGSDRRDILRPHREREPIHDLAPRPKAVGLVATDFRQPRHSALECVAVHICHSG